MNSDKHPLEAALRAQAERRRAELKGAPEMPGPMRAALQREVAKQHAPAPKRDTWLDRLFRGQAFFATIATAVVTVGFFAYSQGWFRPRVLQNETAAAPPATAPAPKPAKSAEMVELAKKQDEAPRSFAETTPAGAKEAGENNVRLEESRPAPVFGGVPPAAPPAQPAPGGSVVADELKRATPETERGRVTEEVPADRRRDGLALDRPVAPPSPVVEQPAPPATTTREVGPGALGSVTARKPVAPAPAPPVARTVPPASKTVQPPAAPEPAARAAAGGSALAGGPNTQRFKQAPTPTQFFNSTAKVLSESEKMAGQVLSDFTLTQTGNAITVTARDGSVFRGQIVPENSQLQNRARSLRQQQVPKGGESVAEGYSFRATGLSKTLQQTVVIEADVEPIAAVVPGQDKDQQAARDAKLKGARKSEERSQEQQRLRLVGEVRVQSQVVEVEAMSQP